MQANDTHNTPRTPRGERGGARMRKPTRVQTRKTDSAMPLDLSTSSGPTRLRVIPLGGVGEFGRNMMVIEYGKDMVIVDMGLMFPMDNMPGIDYVLPDTTYVKKNRHKVRGVFITHGHLDHTGALPYLIKDIGNPPVYGTKLTVGMIRDRLEEFGLERHVRLVEVDPDDILQLGIFKLSFFRVNHNIPDSVGVAIKTPVGVIINTGDWKFDHTPQDQRPTEFGKIAKLGAEGVLLLCSDSTNAGKPGYAMSEREIQQNLETVFAKAKGRIIIATFASLISRIQQIINAATDLNRKVAISGMSMEKALATAARIGFLKIAKGTLIKVDQIHQYPDNRVIVISTGSQGQESSSLGRMSRGEHRHVKLQKGDTIVLSSSPIPGNERSVMNLMNKLYGLGADVIYQTLFDVHTSGHAYREEIKLMLGLARPKYFMPIHGERFMQIRNAEVAQQLGWDDKNIFIMNNGDILEFNQTGQARLSSLKIEIDYIMVDGLGVGDVSDVVIRDRQVLAQDGMVVVITTLDREGNIASSPDIISRGFIYVKNAEQLISAVRSMAKRIIEQNDMKNIENWTSVRNRLRDDIGAFLFQKTEKRPMIIPVIIRV